MGSEEEMGLETSIISVITEEMKNHWSVPQGSIPVEMSGVSFVSSSFHLRIFCCVPLKY